MEETYLDENYLIEEDECDVEETNDIEEEEHEKSDPEMYHCSACDVDFVSVRDHIKTFHNKHDVLVEVMTIKFIIILIAQFVFNCR